MEYLINAESTSFFLIEIRKKKVSSISKLKIRSETDFSLLLPNITIWNLEHKLKVCHSQNTAVANRYDKIFS